MIGLRTMMVELLSVVPPRQPASQEETEFLLPSPWLSETHAVDNEDKLHAFFKMLVATDIDADAPVEERKGYMVQGVMRMTDKVFL